MTSWIRPDPVDVVPSGQEITLAMRAAAPISGTVTSSDGKSLYSAALTAWRGEKPTPFGTVTDRSGAFTLLVPADEPGPYTLKIEPGTATKGRSGEFVGATPGQTGVRVVVAHQ